MASSVADLIVGSVWTIEEKHMVNPESGPTKFIISGLRPTLNSGFSSDWGDWIVDYVDMAGLTYLLPEKHFKIRFRPAGGDVNAVQD